MRDLTLLPETTYVSELCKSDADVDHARCRHASNRARTDGCTCRCHAPTSHDDVRHPA